MAPGRMSPGATSPGMTSSSPVENSATRGRAATVNSARPIPAARPILAGARRSPFESTTAPRVTSSPAARTHWPAVGTALMRTRAPPSRAWVSSCITTASAPAGIGAPVKMRAALRAASGVPDCPAAMRCDTGSSAPAAATSAARTA